MWKTESSRCHRILELLIGQVVMFLTKTGLCCESVGTIYLPKKYRGSLNSPRQPPFRSHLDVGNFLESRCSGETARIRLEDMVKPGFHDSIPSVGSMATFIALSFGATRVVPDGPEAWKRQSQRQTRGIADAHNNQDSKPYEESSLCLEFPLYIISYFIFSNVAGIPSFFSTPSRVQVSGHLMAVSTSCHHWGLGLSVPCKPVAPKPAPSVASGGALGVFSALGVATISGTRRGLSMP